jgi:hypothetical protein
MKRDLEYLECSCTSAEHLLRFTFDDGKWDDCCPEIYIDVQLNCFHGFWKRLWLGIRYIFGYKCRYGHWDETLLLGDQVRRLRAICDKHLEMWDEWEKAHRSVKTAGNP